jgi:hypothetical protein
VAPALGCECSRMLENGAHRAGKSILSAAFHFRLWHSEFNFSRALAASVCVCARACLSCALFHFSRTEVVIERRMLTCQVPFNRTIESILIGNRTIKADSFLLKLADMSALL